MNKILLKYCRNWQLIVINCEIKDVLLLLVDYWAHWLIAQNTLMANDTKWRHWCSGHILVSIQSIKKEAKPDPSFYRSENNLGFNQEASVVTYGVFWWQHTQENHNQSSLIKGLPSVECNPLKILLLHFNNCFQNAA